VLYGSDRLESLGPGATPVYDFYFAKDPGCTGSLNYPCIDPVNYSFESRVLFGTPLLRTDSRITYVDSDNDGIWNPGRAAFGRTAETIVLDNDNNMIYGSNDAVIAGSPPALNTKLSFDLKLMYNDASNNSRFDAGETIVWVE